MERDKHASSDLAEGEESEEGSARDPRRGSKGNEGWCFDRTSSFWQGLVRMQVIEFYAGQIEAVR